VEVIVTDHAAERWSTRVEPGSSHRQALERIADLALAAAPLKRRTLLGQEIWRTESPAAGLVIKRDQGKVVIVTVLSARQLEEAKPSEDEPEEESSLPRVRTTKISFEVEWTHLSGDLESVEQELRRFLANRMTQGLFGRGPGGRATVERARLDE
jgi:hypothetical protein